MFRKVKSGVWAYIQGMVVGSELMRRAWCVKVMGGCARGEMVWAYEEIEVFGNVGSGE